MFYVLTTLTLVIAILSGVILTLKVDKTYEK